MVADSLSENKMKNFYDEPDVTVRVSFWNKILQVNLLLSSKV